MHKEQTSERSEQKWVYNRTHSDNRGLLSHRIGMDNEASNEITRPLIEMLGFVSVQSMIEGYNKAT